MNRQKVTEQILNIVASSESVLQLKLEPYFTTNRGKFDDNVKRVTEAFSGLWLGYHANVYYSGFATPAPGDTSAQTGV